MQKADQIGDDFVVSAHVHSGARIGHRAAKTGKILTEADQDTAGRQLVVVERVVNEAVAEQGGQIGALLQLDANRERSLSEGKAIRGSNWKYWTRSRYARLANCIWHRKCREQIRIEVIATVQLARQRDFLRVRRITQLQRQ